MLTRITPNTVTIHVVRNSYLGPKIWEILLIDLKKTKSLAELKVKLRTGTLKIIFPYFARHTCKTLILFLNLKSKVNTPSFV